MQIDQKTFFASTSIFEKSDHRKEQFTLLEHHESFVFLTDDDTFLFHKHLIIFLSQQSVQFGYFGVQRFFRAITTNQINECNAKSKTNKKRYFKYIFNVEFTKLF